MGRRKVPLEEAMLAYFEFRENVITRNGRLAPGTLARDRQVMKRFLLENGNIPTASLSELHTTRYFAAVAESRSRSGHNDIATLRKFVEFAQNRGWLSRAVDPLFGHVAPNLEANPRLYIPRDEFDEMLDHAEKHHPRDRMVVALGLHNLNRNSDTRGLLIKHVDRAKGSIATYMQKVKRWNHKPISEQLDKELLRWLTWYAEQAARQGLGPLQDHWYLCPTRTGYRPSGHDPGTGRWTGGDALGVKPDTPTARLEPISHRVIVDLGYPIRDPVTGKSLHEGGHTLRRSGALGMWEWLLEEGHPHPIRVVREMLGHQSDQQTEAYIGKKPYRLELEKWVKGKKMYGGGVSAGVTRLEEWRRARSQDVEV